MTTDPFSQFLSASEAITSIDILAAMLLSLGLGIVIAMVYRASVPGRLMSTTLQSTLVLLAMVASMVMMVIGDNLARAFSLVGALAIVRFRTRLRSPWDISFVFFALTAGIACGVRANRVALLGTLVITLTVLALQVLPLSGVRGQVQLFRVDLSAYQGSEENVLKVLDGFVRRRWLLEARSLRFGETLSLRYRIVLKNEQQREELLRVISEQEGVERVILYADEDGNSQT